MALWSRAKKTTIADRLAEERVYELVLQEIESGERRGGLWLKAIEDARGDEKEAKLLYIRYRVQSMKDELAIAAAFVASENAHEQDALNGYDSNGHTPLMKAVKSCDLLRVEDLLAKGADASLRDNNFGTSTASDMARLALRRAKSEAVRDTLQKIIAALDSA